MKIQIRIAVAIVAMALAAVTGYSRVRLPIGVGSLYPANGEPLRKSVEEYLAAVDPIPLPGRIVAVMAPHASFPASGAITAAAFKSLQKGQFKRVIVLSPATHSDFRGCSIPSVEEFRTPMGDIGIDGHAVRQATLSSIIELRAVIYDAAVYNDPNIRRSPLHENETAIEPILPFLQEQLGKFQLVPILVGQFDGFRGGRDESGINECVRVIRKIVDDDTLIVVCSDLTRYGAANGFTPFKDDILTHIGELDMEAVRLIGALDYRGFQEYLKRTKNQISGAMCIAIMMKLLSPSAHGVLVSYDVSGRMTGNLQASVSFASMAFVDNGHGGAAQRPTVLITKPDANAPPPAAPHPILKITKPGAKATSDASPTPTPSEATPTSAPSAVKDAKDANEGVSERSVSK